MGGCPPTGKPRYSGLNGLWPQGMRPRLGRHNKHQQREMSSLTVCGQTSKARSQQGRAPSLMPGRPLGVPWPAPACLVGASQSPWSSKDARQWVRAYPTPCDPLLTGSHLQRPRFQVRLHSISMDINWGGHCSAQYRGLHKVSLGNSSLHPPLPSSLHPVLPGGPEPRPAVSSRDSAGSLGPLARPGPFPRPLQVSG